MKYYCVERFPHAAGYELAARDWRHALKLVKEKDCLHNRVRMIREYANVREYRMDKSMYGFAIIEIQ